MGKKRFYLIKTYINKIYSLYIIYIFKELLDFFKFFIFINY